MGRNCRQFLAGMFRHAQLYPEKFGADVRLLPLFFAAVRVQAADTEIS